MAEKKKKKNEEIFNATELTPLAVEYKRKIAKGDHDGAHIILEKIIIGSTQMFLRLAQYEGYHRTVDVDRLVSAAQSKVIKWLEAWNIKKGPLFSFFSKPLSGFTLVTLANGERMTLQEIVENEYAYDILTVNENTGEIESKRITGWFKQPAELSDWRIIHAVSRDYLDHPVANTLWAAKDHPIITPEGDVNAGDITPFHQVLTYKPGRDTGGNRTRSLLPRMATPMPFTKDYDDVSLNFKYCIEVEDNHNFFAEHILVRNCSKYAFLSEISKETQYRSRYHVTGDNLESIYGAENHPSMKDEAVNAEQLFNGIFVRWGSSQEQDAIRYLLHCIVEDDHDKQGAIKGAAFTWGISFEMSKFFYNWCLMELRTRMYAKAHIPFTEQDLFRHANSYSPLVDLLDIVSWDQLKKIIAIMGGTRLKIPTLAQMTKLANDYKTAQRIDHSDQDIDSVATIAKDTRRSVKTAQQAYTEIVDMMSVDRSGEHELFPHS